MDRDNKREITISISESIYEELQNAAKQLSGWEHEQLQLRVEKRRKQSR